MINLIPNQEKKKKVKDFYFRLTIVFFIVLGVCMIIGSVLILPSYFLSSVRKNINEERLQMQKNEIVPIPDQNTVTAIKNLNIKLNIIENAEKDRYLVSQKVINAIMLRKMPDIKITEISYDNSTLEGKKVTIRGLAVSRERLLLFRRALEDDVAFKKVDLPISNFVKGSNIEFYLNLIPS